jgi:hypothetical protein
VGAIRRFGLVVAVLLASVLLLAAEGGAASDRVVLSGDVRVPNGEIAGEVVVFSGNVAAGGLVRGDVVVFRGRISVTGQVSGDVVSFSGPVLLGPNAQVGGSVIARDSVTRSEGAQVGGSVGRAFPVSLRAPALLAGRWGLWLAVSVSVLLLGALSLLLAPRGADEIRQVVVDSRLRVVAWGVGLVIGLPLLAVLAAVSLVGLPFALGLLLALAFLYSLAYTWAVWIVGRLILVPPRHRWLAFLLGWAIVRAASLVPYLEVALWSLGAVVGLGAMAVAIWRARRKAPSAVTGQPIVPGWDDQTLAP